MRKSKFKQKSAQKTIHQHLNDPQRFLTEKAANGLNIPANFQFGATGSPTDITYMGTGTAFQGSPYTGPQDPYAYLYDQPITRGTVTPAAQGINRTEVLQGVATGLQAAGAVAGQGGNKLGNAISAISPALSVIPGIGPVAGAIGSALGGFINLFGHKKPEVQLPDIKIVRPTQTYDPRQNGIEGSTVLMANGGSIDIKESHRGLFTKEAEQHNMSVAEFATYVLNNKGKFSQAVIKRAQFAKNAQSFDHSKANNGTTMKEGDIVELSPEDLKRFNSFGYKFTTL